MRRDVIVGYKKPVRAERLLLTAQFYFHVQGRKDRLYLGAPFSCKLCPELELVRVQEIAFAGISLIRAGFVVFSPVNNSHPMSLFDLKNKNNHDVWLNQDIQFVDWADALVVLMLPGWEDSYGLKKEVEWFNAVEKPILYTDLSEMYKLYALVKED